MPETLDCRSPSACASCRWADRRGACTLEAELDLALEALAAERTRHLVAVQAPGAMRRATA